VRIVSLVPHATELLFALGLGPEVVGVTHECDHPRAARAAKWVTRDVLPAGLSAAEIDAAVRERTLRGEAIYELDREAVAALSPDLIVTQALCPVCAVSYTEVAGLAERLPSRPRVISLDPHTLGETLDDVHTLAEAPRAHSEALAYAGELAALAARRVVAVNASAYFSRPGPRLIDGLELLAHILHPECVPSAPDIALPVG
jgi:iron complex transport system substrate-binding protein